MQVSTPDWRRNGASDSGTAATVSRGGLAAPLDADAEDTRRFSRLLDEQSRDRGPETRPASTPNQNPTPPTPAAPPNTVSEATRADRAASPAEVDTEAALAARRGEAAHGPSTAAGTRPEKASADRAGADAASTAVATASSARAAATKVPAQKPTPATTVPAKAATEEDASTPGRTARKGASAAVVDAQEEATDRGRVRRGARAGEAASAADPAGAAAALAGVPAGPTLPALPTGDAASSSRALDPAAAQAAASLAAGATAPAAATTPVDPDGTVTARSGPRGDAAAPVAASPDGASPIAAGERRDGTAAARDANAAADRFRDLLVAAHAGAAATPPASGAAAARPMDPALAASLAGLSRDLGTPSATTGAGTGTADSTRTAPLGALAGLSAPTPTTLGDPATEAVSRAIPAPVAGPEFAPALAASVTLLARDGIGQATLTLNPPEMGPVSVRIEVDGTRAHVDFTAALGPTRDAIESGLPTLAGALSDAGLTLSGGGVFEQQQPPRQDPGTPEGQAAGGGRQARGLSDLSGHEAVITPPVVRRVAVGGVDLYA